MRLWGGVLLAFLCLVVSGAADDYDRTRMPSSAAQRAFGAVRTNLTWETIDRNSTQCEDEDCAYYTDDGGISIPPGGMITFKNSGKCMDAHLPAPSSGEPMQFISANQLINPRLRKTYERLLERQSQGDSSVSKNNLQHLVWALRLAGTDDPIANNLSDAQRELLDECSGRRGGFTKFHERERRRNAKGRRSRSGGSRISVGNVSYDAADLAGTNGAQRIVSHMSALTEMGEKSTVRSDSNFRYGEIEEDFYSDVTCNGGLSFSARVINASRERRVFRAADFAAQVGNGTVSGAQRQRVTMTTPREFAYARGAVVAGTDFIEGLSVSEAEFSGVSSGRSTKASRRRIRKAAGTSNKSKRSEKKAASATSSISDIGVIPPLSPVPPMTAVTNVVEKCAAEGVRVRVVSVDYDASAHSGIAVVEIIQGSFRTANNYIRGHFKELLQNSEWGVSRSALSDGVSVKIDAFSIRNDEMCEIKFNVRQ